MIREFFFRAYLVAFGGSVIFAWWIVPPDRGALAAIGFASAVFVFWLVIGWICKPLFRGK